MDYVDKPLPETPSQANKQSHDVGASIRHGCSRQHRPVIRRVKHILQLRQPPNDSALRPTASSAAEDQVQRKLSSCAISPEQSAWRPTLYYPGPVRIQRSAIWGSARHPQDLSRPDSVLDATVDTFDIPELTFSRTASTEAEQGESTGNGVENLVKQNRIMGPVTAASSRTLTPSHCSARSSRCYSPLSFPPSPEHSPTHGNTEEDNEETLAEMPASHAETHKRKRGFFRRLTGAAGIA